MSETGSFDVIDICIDFAHRYRGRLGGRGPREEDCRRAVFFFFFFLLRYR